MDNGMKKDTMHGESAVSRKESVNTVKKMDTAGERMARSKSIKSAASEYRKMSEHDTNAVGRRG